MKKKKIVHITNLSSHIKSKKFDDFFLGKWCNLYSKNDKLFLNYKFKEKRNFKKIQKNNLFFLSRALNDYHKTNYSKNFWKILLYPWIYNFSYILSDRFDVIKKLKKINNVDNFLVTDDKPNIIFEDFLHSISNYQADIFNNNIFKDLINLESNKKIKNFKTKKKISIKKNKKIIYRNYKKIFGFFSNKKIIFFDSGLSIKKNFSLHLKYHFFNNRVLIKKNKKIDLKFRKKISNIKILKNDFQTILNYMSLKYLPKSYLENFKTFILNSKFESLNKNPKIILTSHSHITDDMFKIWYAKICEKNKKVKLFVFQKGSEYFLKNESTRNLSYQILDKKLTWGSFMDKEKKNLCLGLNSNLNYDLKKRKKINILYVCTEFPKYFFKNNSISHGPNFLDHILLHEKFFKNLNFKVIDKIDVKLYIDNFGWNISTRLKKINKKINFIKETDISKLYNLYDIVIPAGPSTTFLECIYLNIPVITLFERNVWQVNDKTTSFLNKLKKKRFYFDNPINASKYLNNNLDKIKINWYSKSTQSILNQFRKKFIVKNENFSSDLSKIIDN